MIIQLTKDQIEITLAALHHYIQKTGLSDVTMSGRTITGLSHLDVIHGVTVALRNGEPDPVVEDSPKEPEDNIVPLNANGEDAIEDEIVTPS